jgi:hypothetical protein
VISREQLRAAGFTDNEVKGRIKRGHLLPLHRGVYAVGHRRLARHAHLVAALLATGPDAFLSHRTAAAVWGLREITTPRTDVTVPGRGRRRRGSLIVHCSRDSEGVTIRSDLRVSSVPRMLIELAPREPRRELDRLITQSVRKGILDLEKMQVVLARYSRRPGLANLRVALQEYLPKPDRKSGLEVAFDRLLAQHPEIPRSTAQRPHRRVGDRLLLDRAETRRGARRPPVPRNDQRHRA